MSHSLHSYLRHRTVEELKYGLWYCLEYEDPAQYAHVLKMILEVLAEKGERLPEDVAEQAGRMQL